MSLLRFIGFETGSLLEFESAGSGTFEIVSDIKRSGAFSARLQLSGASSRYIVARTFSGSGGTDSGTFNVANVWAELQFRPSAWPAASESFFLAMDGTSAKIDVRLNADGTLSVFEQASTLLGTTIETIPAGEWTRIGVRVGTGTTAAWELQINGVTVLSGTGDLRTGNTGTIRIGKINVNGSTVDWYFDDIAVDNAEWPGGVSIVRLVPSGVGNYTAWTGAYTDVDEAPHDNDTTYIASSTSGQAFTVALTDAAAAGITGTVKGVCAHAVVRDEGGTSALRYRLRSGTTDADTTSNNDPGASYVMRQLLRAVDPATSAAWTLSAIDNIEVGVLNNASEAVRCTQLCATVAFVPPPVPDPSGTVTLYPSADAGIECPAGLDHYKTLSLTEPFSGSFDFEHGETGAFNYAGPLPIDDREIMIRLMLTRPAAVPGSIRFYVRVRTTDGCSQVGSDLGSLVVPYAELDAYVPAASDLVVPAAERDDIASGQHLSIEWETADGEPEAPDPPDAPTNLSARITDTTEIELSWDDAEGVTWTLSTNGGAVAPITPTLFEGRQYHTVSGLTPNQESAFAVRAVVAGVSSAPATVAETPRDVFPPTLSIILGGDFGTVPAEGGWVRVEFSEPVTGVTAADWTIRGVPIASVEAVSSTVYRLVPVTPIYVEQEVPFAYDGTSVEDAFGNKLAAGAWTARNDSTLEEPVGGSFTAEDRAMLQAIVAIVTQAATGVAAIKARTDNLPTTPAAAGEYNLALGGIALAIDGIEVGGGGGASGDGDTPVDHNTGGVDALRFVRGGVGADNVRVLAYLASEYDAGQRVRRGEAWTGPDGRWVAPLLLNAGHSYVLVATVPAVTRPQVIRLTWSSNAWAVEVVS